MAIKNFTLAYLRKIRGKAILTYTFILYVKDKDLLM